MLKNISFILLLIASFISGWFLKVITEEKDTNIPFVENGLITKEKPLEKYAFENLSIIEIKTGDFVIKESLKETDEFESFLFTYEFNPSLDGKTYKKITGQINLPILQGSELSKNSFPVILMFRGYIDQTLFRTGDGTRNASEYFAKNGFITIAPDFLGYGGSDKESGNIFETRFQTYVTALSLLKYLESNPEIKFENWNLKIGNLFMWGHSNGGQIALTTLEITGADYPTTLWAPVSKPFPYSVLYYTDESEDHGKLIRTELSKFEQDYNVEKYSLTNYLDKINAPIQIHQGQADEAVPLSWSNTLATLLKEKDKEVRYYTYPGTDHNLRPNWDRVIERDLEFFNRPIDIDI